MKEEKKFLKPEVLIIEFTNDDIITGSGGEMDEEDFDKLP